MLNEGLDPDTNFFLFQKIEKYTDKYNGIIFFLSQNKKELKFF